MLWWFFVLNSDWFMPSLKLTSFLNCCATGRKGSSNSHCIKLGKKDMVQRHMHIDFQSCPNWQNLPQIYKITKNSTIHGTLKVPDNIALLIYRLLGLKNNKMRQVVHNRVEWSMTSCESKMQNFYALYFLNIYIKPCWTMLCCIFFLELNKSMTF